MTIKNVIEFLALPVLTCNLMRVFMKSYIIYAVVGRDLWLDWLIMKSLSSRSGGGS